MADKGVMDLLQSSKGYIGRNLSGYVPGGPMSTPGVISDQNYNPAVPHSSFESDLIWRYNNGMLSTPKDVWDNMQFYRRTWFQRSKQELPPEFEDNVLRAIGFTRTQDGKFQAIPDTAKTPVG